MSCPKELLAVMLVISVCAAEELIPMDRSKIGKPPRLFGIVLRSVSGRMVDSRGEVSPVDRAGAERAAANCGGYPSVNIDPERSLEWTLPDSAKGDLFLCFLVRTGHQRGYEYVHPIMTYTVTLDGQPIELEPVYEVGAVRVFQSKDSWGHDMGWIRSREKLRLKPGQKVRIGCKDKYAFVSQGLLVSDQANRLTKTIGQVKEIEARMGDLSVLAYRVADVFPTVKASRQAIDGRLKTLRDRLAQLQADIDTELKKVESGAVPSPDQLIKRSEVLADDVVKAEDRSDAELCAALTSVRQALTDRLAALRSIPQADYYARDCAYATDVAKRYLEAAREIEARRGTAAARRLATYLWRADQFLARAAESKELSSGGHATAPSKRPDVEALKPSTRGDLLLNGMWEIDTSGSPSDPPQDGWWPIRVPHGPWHETVGTFMALDRTWPKGQHWAWYRVRFPVPRQWQGSVLRLRFDAVFHLCEVYVNGEFVGRHIGGFDPFEFDITGFVTPGEMAELTCFVHDTLYTALDKSPREDQPKGWSSGPNHYVISDAWGARFGGIWQDVHLIAVPRLAVRDTQIITSFQQRTLSTKTTIECPEGSCPPITVRQDVLREGKVVLALPEKTVESENRLAVVAHDVPWPDAKLWGIGGEYGDPSNLYYLRTRLFVPGESKSIDTRYDRFGFREFWIANGQFYLNGKRLPLLGGGTWYLQEGKISHGHRWFAQRFFALERGMNVNIERWHRHGDVADEFFDITDELGMLNEPEGAYWGCYGMPDILGYADFDDPVWIENVTEHYRAWVRKHWNHPSIVLWSIENETFTRAQRPPGMLDRFLALGDAVKAVDPTRPITYHGCENGQHATKNPRIEIANLHYPSNDRVADWKEKWGGRPCIDGEFQSYPPLFLMSSNDPKIAAENLSKLQQWITQKWAYYQEVELSGSFYFLPYMAALFSTAKPEWMGPWHDLLPPLKDAPVTKGRWRKGSAQLNTKVPITWPSLSGRGIKCEQLRTGVGHLSFINWFDPNRPVATPTPVYETLKQSWQQMPPLRKVKAPEVIVMVTRAGQPVANAAVLATPLDGQCTSPFGVMTDPAGTAWLVFREPGRYRLSCGGKTTTFAAEYGQLDAPPGFADIPRVKLILD